MKDETLQKMRQLIASADAAEVRVLSDALHTRTLTLRDTRQREALRTLKVGDKVRLKGLKPQYLNGTLAVVESRKGSRFRVVLDGNADPRATRRFGDRPLVPAGSLEVVD